MISPKLTTLLIALILLAMLTPVGCAASPTPNDTPANGTPAASATTIPASPTVTGTTPETTVSPAGPATPTGTPKTTVTTNEPSPTTEEATPEETDSPDEPAPTTASTTAVTTVATSPSATETVAEESEPQAEATSTATPETTISPAATDAIQTEITYGGSERVDTPADSDGSNSEGTQSEGIRIQVDYPARTVEAGETAVFTININNRGAEERARRLFASIPASAPGWEYRFTDQEKDEVNMVDIPNGGQQSVRFEVDTAAESDTGQYPVTVHVGEETYPLYITISKSHRGDKARLKLVVNDKDGNKVRNAEILVFARGTSAQIDRILTAADGTVNVEVAPGDYDLQIGREGYTAVTRNDVRLRGGMETDLGTVTLEPKPYAAEVTLGSSTVVGTVGKNAQFELEVRNIGRTDDTYRLGAEDVPEEWYVRYRDKENSNAEVEEISVAPGEARQLLLEAIPSRNTGPGIYNLTAIVQGGGETYSRNLTVRMQGAADMRVTSDQYQYDVSRGDALEFNFTVQNNGNAGALTNLNATISAPEGWSGVLTPQSVGSISPGGSVDFQVRLVPPSSIPASEYRISVKVIADQAEKTDEYRVIVHEQSYTALLGIALLCVVVGGVWFFFKRFQRK